MPKFKSNEVLKNQTSGKNEKDREKEKAAETRVSQRSWLTSHGGAA